MSTATRVKPAARPMSPAAALAYQADANTCQSCGHPAGCEDACCDGGR